MTSIKLQVASENQIRSEIANLLDSLPDEALAPLKELAESAAEVSETTTVTLPRVIQRMFVRSVNEFFTAEHVSMQMTQERLRRFRPSTHPQRIELPNVDAHVEVPFDDVAGRRRSVRDYVASAMDLGTFSAVLKRSFGKNGSEDGYGVRDLPLYPYPSMGGWRHLMWVSQCKTLLVSRGVTTVTIKLGIPLSR